MQINSFNEMYVAELQELTSAEQLLAQTLPQMAELASNEALKDAFTRQGEEIASQQKRLISILEARGANPMEHTDQAMQALVNEAQKMAGMLPAGDLRDAGLIASAQKLAHYEMAALGTAAALAGQLDLREEQEALHTCLQEQQGADAKLSALAKAEINPQAVRT